MEIKEVLYNGAQIKLVAINRDELKNIYSIILEKNIAIYRIKKDNNLVVIPPVKINQFLGTAETDSLTFYVEKDWYDNNVVMKEKVTDEMKDRIKLKIDLKRNLKKFQQMSVSERAKVLDARIEKIKENLEKDQPIGTVELLEIVNSVIDTFCLNKATLEENMKSMLSKENIMLVIEKTKLLVEAIIKFLQQDNVKYNELNQLEKVKTESQVLDHMHKVMLRFIPFCLFYNEYFTDGLITSFRAKFKKKFLPYYIKLHKETNISLERVFYRGMRRLTVEEIKEFALGAIFHDIGKVPDVIYHEWEKGYNKEEVIKHAKHGFKLVMATKELPLSTAVMTALHHEYYGHKDGYNLVQNILPDYEDKRKKNKFDYSITYNVKDFLTYQAMSYFPCKLLEIIDIFDAIYEEKFGKENFLSISDILYFMKENYIEHDLKIDPILFSIFIEFARVYEGIPDPDSVKHLRF